MTENAVNNQEEALEIPLMNGNVMEEITSLIRARVPIIWVVTHEETRFIDEFVNNLGPKCKRKTFIWSGWQGIVTPKDYKLAKRSDDPKLAESWNPAKALNIVAEIAPAPDAPGYVFLLRDFHAVLQEGIIRQIRDMYEFLAENGKSLIVISPVLGYGPDGKHSGLPPTLEKQVVVVNYALPTREQIELGVRDVIGHIKKAQKGGKTKLEYTDTEYLEISRALQGLTFTEIYNSVSTCLAHIRRLDPERLINDKRQIVRKNGILEFIDTHVDIKDVGGLDNAKLYLSRYADAHAKPAVEFGVEPLKGVILTGVPGTGKSLFSKAMGHLWKEPLLRLDVGKVMSGLVGGSEQKMRDMIATAEAMAPCVLWIDEVEKSLSGTKSSNMTDGGTMSRVFGTLLTAMQDGMQGVTVIATANDIQSLPPEFIRRFNEVFFVDLPGPDERWDIFKIHIAKRGRDPKKFEGSKKELLEVSENYTGAEIEKAVKDGVARAYYEGDTDLKPIHILSSLKETKPIYKVYGKKVKEMQEWAATHARYASSWSEKKAKKEATGKKVSTADLDNALGELGGPKKDSPKKAPANAPEPAVVPAGDGGGRFAGLDEEQT